MVWTKDKPMVKLAYYWWRPLGNNAKARVVQATQLMIDEYEARKGEWSHCPVPLPDEHQNPPKS